MEITKSLRYRVLVSRGMKGGTSFEVVVDAENYTMAEVLAESDKLVAALEQRYPAPQGG